MIPLALLWCYFRTRKLHFTDCKALKNWQAKRLHQFRQNVLFYSPWFQHHLTLSFNQWPTMDKALATTHFDEMNTTGLKRGRLLDCTIRSEQSHNFRPCVGRFSTGLSSGTSGHCGLFVASLHGQQMWVAGVLVKVLLDGLFARKRVALLLRADSNLYQSVNNRWLSLSLYDLLAPFQA